MQEQNTYTKKRSKSRRNLFIGIVLAVIIVVILFLVFKGSGKEGFTNVETEKVETRTITQVVNATGKIDPINKVVITPEVTGEIVELPVEEGDKVTKGQLLIRIKPDIYEAQRDEAKASLQGAEANLKVTEANLAKVKSEYNRMKGLFNKGLASDADLESSKASYLSAEGSYEAQKATVMRAKESLKQAVENLAKTAIYSSLDGTVSELNVELRETVLGSNFTQGTNIMTVADLDKMEAIVDVDENDVVLISEGDTAYVHIDAFGDRNFLGEVHQIGNTAQSSGLGTQEELVNFEVKIKLLELDTKIRPGMSCDADIQTETKMNVISVPIQSVTIRTTKSMGIDSGDVKEPNAKNEAKEVVFLVEDSKAIMKEVKTGISDDTYIEIKSGISAGASVVSGPYRAISKDLSDSTKVFDSKDIKKTEASK